MAARRIAKSGVDWAAFAERVPPNQRECFKAFRAKSDMFVSRVHKYPEAVPKIDFASYKSKLPNPAMVDAFQKSFEALKVPYPVDKDNTVAAIDKQEQESKIESDKYVAGLRQAISEVKVEMDGLALLPPLEQMTQQMYAEYFPDLARNPSKPTFYPHDKKSQPEHDPDTIS